MEKTQEVFHMEKATKEFLKQNDALKMKICNFYK